VLLNQGINCNYYFDIHTWFCSMVLVPQPTLMRYKIFYKCCVRRLSICLGILLKQRYEHSHHFRCFYLPFIIFIRPDLF
jgi:hypothetical protein